MPSIEWVDMPDTDFDAGPLDGSSFHTPVMRLVNDNPFPVGADLRLGSLTGDVVDGGQIPAVEGSVVVPPRSEIGVGIQVDLTTPGQVGVNVGHRVAGPEPGASGPCLMTNPLSLENLGDDPVGYRTSLTTIDAASFQRISAYVSDTLAVGDLTVNLGLRFDRQVVSREGWTEANPTFPDLLPEVSFAGDQAFTWSDIAPRVGLTYDVGDSALLKASYASYADNLDTGPAGSGNVGYSYMYFEGPGADPSPYDLGSVPEPPIAPDPYLYSSPMTNELVLRPERALTDDVATALTFRRRSAGTWQPRVIGSGGGARPLGCGDWVSPPPPKKKSIGNLLGLGAGVIALTALLFVLLSPGGEDPVSVTSPTDAPSTEATPAATEATPAVTEGTPAVTEATPAVTEATPAVTEGTPATDPPPELSDDPMDQAIIAILRDGGFSDQRIARVFELGIPDAIADWIYSISGAAPGDPTAEADIKRVFAWAAGLGPEAVNGLFANTVFPCDLVEGERVVACASEAFPDGDAVLIATELDGPVPVVPVDHSYTFAAVFADRDLSNDFTFFDPFDWDFYRDTDRWYELIGDPATGSWTVRVSEWTDGGAAPVTSGARAVLEHNTIVWWIPADEVGPDPRFRVSAFRHDGTFGQAVSAGDVLGADPTEPLAEVIPTDIEILSVDG